MTEQLFTPEQLIDLETDLVEALQQQGFPVEDIKLIGLKGSGYHSTVFSVLIDGDHHVLKVYRTRDAFTREIKHLRKLVPADRFMFIWKAESNRYNYPIVVLQVPEGSEMRPGDINAKVAERFAACCINLHSLRYRKRITTRALLLRLEEKRPPALAHAADFNSLEESDLDKMITLAQKYIRKHATNFRVQRSRCHGDLWWGNVIVAAEAVYLIDWEGLKSDDYCDDLAKFRILANLVRNSDPQTLYERDIAESDLDAFMDVVLARYQSEFQEPNMLGRYGFYGFLISLVIFANYYYGDKRGTKEAKDIMNAGIDLFRKYCLTPEGKLA